MHPRGVNESRAVVAHGVNEPFENPPAMIELQLWITSKLSSGNHRRDVAKVFFEGKRKMR
jgi:hypothetical protein